MSMIRILWRSNHCIAVFKPAGLATQAPAAHDSLEARLRAQLEQTPGDFKLRYLALPHRLDRAVSGVLLAALSKRAAGLLGQQFETRKVAKTYLAWVQGQISGESGQWSDRLRKLPGQAKAEIVPAAASHAEASAGQQAVTQMRVVARRPAGSLLELQPVTGRMHQLRIQAAERGHPILGDALYGSSERWTNDADSPAQADAAEAIALHAWKIRFHDPQNGKAVSVEAPPDWPAAWLK